VQFHLTTEDEWAHVEDSARLIAVDRRALDEGTASADAATVDVEDYAVLFELDRMRAARRGLLPTDPQKYDVLFLDEAQELAPLELAFLGRTLSEKGTLIVAGDADQQTDPTTFFAGWGETMRELGSTSYHEVRLDIGYRCPEGVVSLARAILGVRSHTADRPRCLGFDDERALVDRIGEDIANLLARDPHNSVAILTRRAAAATRIAQGLKAHVPTRVVWDGRFLRRGPVQVAMVDEAKGLEFDTVIVPDAGAAEYPDDPAARRTLYVAVTRARHQVLLAHTGPRSPIVPRA
jgi:DNA helicase IV